MLSGKELKMQWIELFGPNQLQICYLFRHCHVIAAYSNF